MHKRCSGSKRTKKVETPKQNKWTQGAYFNKQIDKMIESGMSLSKATNIAQLRRGF